MPYIFGLFKETQFDNYSIAGNMDNHSLWIIHNGSISSMIYAHIFCTKANWAAYLCLEFGFEQFYVQKMRA